MIRFFIFIIPIFLLDPVFLSAQGNFIVKDVLAADPNASIIDPEYNMTMKTVCWQSEDGEAWVCSLDPVSRCYVPSDG